MEDRSTLINQLSIARGSDASPSRTGLWWLAGIVVLLAAGIGAWYAFAGNGATTVHVATAKLAGAGASQSRAAALDASGYVVARRQATVSSEITGKVAHVYIEEGEHVKAGQLIAQLDDRIQAAQLAQANAQRDQAEANYHAARVAFDNAKPIFQRNHAQFAKKVISAQTYDTAKADYDAAQNAVDVALQAVDVARANCVLAERALEQTRIRAPFAGVVTVKAAQQGEMVSPVSAGGGFTRTGIGTIVDMSSLEIEVDVSEDFINRVRPGQDVTATLNAYPDWRIPAKVIAIIPTADRAKATVKVRVGFKVHDARILPDMGVRVSFLEPSAGAGKGRPSLPAVVIPGNAVQANGDTGVVFVVNDGHLSRQVVRLGGNDSAGQVVLSGLTAGDRIATGDLSRFKDGMRVRVEQAKND